MSDEFEAPKFMIVLDTMEKKITKTAAYICSSYEQMIELSERLRRTHACEHPHLWQCMVLSGPEKSTR